MASRFKKEWKLTTPLPDISNIALLNDPAHSYEYEVEVQDENGNVEIGDSFDSFEEAYTQYDEWVDLAKRDEEGEYVRLSVRIVDIDTNKTLNTVDLYSYDNLTGEDIVLFDELSKQEEGILGTDVDVATDDTESSEDKPVDYASRLEDVSTDNAIEIADSLISELVDVGGTDPAKTAAGEILRALSSIGYNYYTNHEYIFSRGSSNGPKAAVTFLSKVSPDFDDAIQALISETKAADADTKGETYDSLYKELVVTVLNFLKDNPDYFTKENTLNYLDEDLFVDDIPAQEAVEIVAETPVEGFKDTIEDYVRRTYIDTIFAEDSNYSSIKVVADARDGEIRKVTISGLTADQAKELEDVKAGLFDEFEQHEKLLRGEAEEEYKIGSIE